MLPQTIRDLQEKQGVNLSRSCRLFGISRQSIYQAEARTHKRADELQLVKQLVQQVRMDMPRLGTRKLYHVLKHRFEQYGIKMGRDALFTLLRAERMLVTPRKSYTTTTHSRHWLHKYPNLLKDLEIDGAEQVLVSDITFIRTHKGMHYLSLVTDAFSRKIMGYQLSDDLSAESVVKALKMAIRNRQLGSSLIHHSDRGHQYCSALYQSLLRKANIQPSMTEGYDCYQNALAERVNGILKDEFLFHRCSNERELRKLIEQSISIYNSKRPHLSLNMNTPNFIHNLATSNG